MHLETPSEIKMLRSLLGGTAAEPESELDPHVMVKQFYLALSVTTFEAKNEIWEPLFMVNIVPFLRKGDTRLIRYFLTPRSI